MADQKWPVYGEITGPIVMIGFGSIGRGTLPLIERHFKFDKSRMIVIDPRDDRTGSCSTSAASPSSRRRHQEELQEALDAAADQGRRPGILRQPLGRHRLGRPDAALPQARRALRRHGGRALARLLFRRQGRQRQPHQLRAARNPAGGEAQVSRRHDGGLHLRRQPGHGILVGQAGARQPRRRPRPEVQGAVAWTTAKAGPS